MDHHAIRAQLRSLVASHLPKNAKSFQACFYDGLPNTNTLGFRIDPQAFTGKVVELTPEIILVKRARTTFAVVDRSLVSLTPAVGEQIEVAPYFRRDFNGERIDKPRLETHMGLNGETYTTKTTLLGGWETRLPLSAPKCPYLSALIEQLETLPAPDGFRAIVHMLVDANAADFTTVDPVDKNVVATPPEISFNVTTEKFQGRVAIIYDRCSDYYVIELRNDDIVIERLESIGFESLGDVLYSLIDDSTWRTIRITVLKSAKPHPQAA